MPRRAGKGVRKKQSARVESKAELLSVDPERVRFQHARIRPVFSGCGYVGSHQEIQKVDFVVVQRNWIHPISILTFLDVQEEC